MSRIRNVQICNENKRIVLNEGYAYDGKFVEFPNGRMDYSRAIVVDSEMGEQYAQKAQAYCENDDIPESERKITVVNADSFAYESDIVMNFANAINPGGGYLRGANAQEEALCRQSTLYASLTSQSASSMYLTNKAINAPFDSGIMVYSPKVNVFRDVNLNLLEKPFTVSIMTAAAPNLNGRAKGQKASVVEKIMKTRIRKYLSSCSELSGCEGKPSITLGAWGCGAFGHDAKIVAGYFRDILIGEGMWKLFDQIIFAVYDKSSNRYNFRAFKSTFYDVETPISKALRYDMNRKVVAKEEDKVEDYNENGSFDVNDDTSTNTGINTRINSRINSSIIPEIMKKMIAYSEGSLHDINHFMKVWSYAQTIGKLEGLDEETQTVLEAAAIVHDIACPSLRERFGFSDGKKQEIEGMPMAKELLEEFAVGSGVSGQCGQEGLTQEQLDRIVYLVGHHHTLNDIDGLDYQILIEADYIVNADESSYSKESIRSFRDKIFKTKAGTEILESIYGI